MFQDNPLLAQLKQQLHAQTPRVEGVIKGTEKSFGFLEVDAQTSYFIPPPFMKKVMPGDRVVAALNSDKDKQVAEPESLIEPYLTRFVGRIQKKENDNRLFVVPDSPMIREVILCRPVDSVMQSLEQGDWVIAEMRRHPLKGDRGFYAEVTEFITESSDHFAPWWVTLSRHQLEREAPSSDNSFEEMLDPAQVRQDLTHLCFTTIDSAETEDMDDALYAQENSDGSIELIVAIADPTAYVAKDSPLDQIARKRAFTNYLPGFNIPMLPRQLSDDICSLHPNVKRPVLACRFAIQPDGAIPDDVTFFSAWIESKAKLSYDAVSDWLEQKAGWQPESQEIAAQIQLLNTITHRRIKWREQHALVFRDRPDYRFVLNDAGDVVEIVTEQRRSANRIVEEAMIAANICAARVLRDELGYGLFNTHAGFDAALINQVVSTLQANETDSNAESLLTLEGFRQMRRYLESLPSQYLDSRLRRFQTYSEISAEPAPHFGLGLDVYATWTSPIRKYGDMVNHRLLKAIISHQPGEKPDEELLTQLAERRRLNRFSERDVSDWLYARYLQDKADSLTKYRAEIIDVYRGGLRVRLLDNGAVAFIPASFIHAVRDELVCSQETGTVMIKGDIVYRQSDTLDVVLAEVKIDTRSIIAKPAA